MSKANARREIKSVLTEDFTTYSLRHSFASFSHDLLKSRPELLSDFMGHSSGKTTAGYIHSITKERPVLDHAVNVWNAFLAS